MTSAKEGREKKKYKGREIRGKEGVKQRERQERREKKIRWDVRKNVRENGRKKRERQRGKEVRQCLLCNID